MASFTGKAAGNWSAVGQTTWNEAGTPAAGDSVDLNGKIIVMDIATIPAGGGSLALLTSAGSAGQLTVDLSATGLNGNATINATTLQAGTTNTGLVYVSVASTNTLTINCTNLYGGAGSADYCIGIMVNINLTVVGNVNGGAGVRAHGIHYGITSGGGIYKITGNLVGGAGANANGINAPPTASLMSVILNSCNIIDGAGGVAYNASVTPTWNLGTTNYFQLSTGTKFYYDVPDIGNVRDNDTLAGVTGTMVTRTLSAANETVAEGYYAATTLSAEDPDLAAANIVSGKTIFGFAGSASGGGATAGPFEIGPFR